VSYCPKTVVPFSLPSIFSGLLVVATTAFLGVRLLRQRRARDKGRADYANSPLPLVWETALRRRMPAHARIPEEVRQRLHRWMKAFLAQKTFTACGGFKNVSDSMAVAIAGHACLLLSGRDGAPKECFPSVESVLVYPDFFYSRVHSFSPESGAEIVGEEARVGEASPMGSVVLSWREVLQAGAFAGNGRNIVLHEFAHHIRPAGAALLAELEAGFRRLRAAPQDEPVIDDYGAENRDEFWAVSIEAFFEKSRRLREAHPAWYAALAAFFALDPAEWEPAP
jgi:Mlc titration factor MtfA (ptsG expression regulator)